MLPRGEILSVLLTYWPPQQTFYTSWQEVVIVESEVSPEEETI